MVTALTPREDGHFEEWLDLLSTTTLPQAESRLAQRRDDGSIGYCCLGLGCKQADQDRALPHA